MGYTYVRKPAARGCAAGGGSDSLSSLFSEAAQAKAKANGA